MRPVEFNLLPARICEGRPSSVAGGTATAPLWASRNGVWQSLLSERAALREAWQRAAAVTQAGRDAKTVMSH